MQKHFAALSQSRRRRAFYSFFYIRRVIFHFEESDWRRTIKIPRDKNSDDSLGPRAIVALHMKWN